MSDTKKLAPIEVHPLADWFPAMSEAELQELADDIRANGLKDPIITCEGKILDGRNRYAACGMAGVEPRFEEWQGGGSLARYVWSRNGVRRNLTTSQKAALGLEFEALLKKEDEAAKTADCAAANEIVAKLPQSAGGVQISPEKHASGRTRDKIADIVGVSPRLLQDAKRVQNESPALFAKVKAGEITTNRALRQIEKSAEAAVDPEKDGERLVSKFIACATATVKTSHALLDSHEWQASRAMNEAVLSLGFALCQLLPTVAMSGHIESVNQARKLIKAISRIEPGSDSRSSQLPQSVQQAASVAEQADPVATNTQPQTVRP